MQSDANPPALCDTNTFALLAIVKECSPVGVTNATIHAPGKPPQRLNAGPGELALTRYFNTTAQFDAAFPDGTFTYSIQTIGDGIVAAPLTVVSNDFPRRTSPILDQ